MSVDSSRFAKPAWASGLPSDWQVLPIKMIVSTPITDGPHETPEFLDEGVVFISAEAIQDGKIDFARRRGFISETDNRRYSRKYSPETGDIYVVKSGATTGKSAMVGEDTDFNIWSPLAVVRSKPSMDSRFVLHAIRSQIVQDAIAINWSWGTQQNIGMGALGRIQVPVPDHATQRQIADFLDRETARIDLLIEKKQGLVALLGEKARRDVSSLFEKLALDHRMWRLKHVLVAGLVYGANEPSDGDDPDDVRYIRITDIAADGNLRDDTFKSLPRERIRDYILEDGDILFARSGATVGKSFIYREHMGECCYAGYLIRARVNRQLVSPDFLKCFTSTDQFWNHILGTNIQATIQNVSAEKYANLAFPLPPLSVQGEISGKVKRDGERYAATKSSVNASIDRLKEYRSALITAAVTGQIDVTTYAKSGTPDRRLDAIQEEMGA
ncbi:restriction endonuclease subunit S [Tropicibacter sp. R16_0]|uniref:restriction endonuclease subunit S n=1 Tax=Tropicibacter sp. R16_0 TaxID=2821102 RepID=UPI001ADACF43|nr:restriction endonuclease subunit S [Tropicibacter sp. R16_0]MBO9452276.1 restriction endonuclease subunit S [Tropicibacter sp. R16_0]